MKYLIPLVLSVLLVACGGGSSSKPALGTSTAPSASSTSSSNESASKAPANVAAPSSSSSSEALPSLSGVVDKVRPATVQVTTQAAVPFGQGGQSLDVPQGTGTGFIYDKQGHVLTNAHVVSGGS